MTSLSLRTLICGAVCIALTGCSLPFSSTTAAGPSTATIAVHGSVHGGQQPVVGGSIQLYAVGTGGDYTAATPLVSTPALSGADGSFSITNQYKCGSSTDVYLVATGGSPAPGITNPNIAMMAALGQCSSLSAATTIDLNELSTVAAVSAMHLFMSSTTHVGSSSYDAASLDQDFTLATQMVSLPAGTAPGANLPAGYSSPATLIDTLGDVLAACINSAGGTAGDASACGRLFSLATPPGGAAPADTLTALLDIVNHPTLQTSGLFNLMQADAPFQPALAAAPASFQIALVPPATATYQLLVEPDDGLQSLYNLVTNAQKTIDLTVYGLQDTIFSGDLVAACQRGVIVRVVLDQNDEKSTDLAAYNQLNAQAGCSAVWANTKYPATHEKSFVVDGTTLAMLTLNIETRDYPGTRDFAVLTNDAGDIAAFEATFNADYAMVYPYATTPGDDLIWSPTTAQTALVGIIDNATLTLQVENEEMSATKIVSALEAACQRGVAVQITMTNQTSYHANFAALEAAGCGVHVYPDSTRYIYIHAKTILADYGTAAQYAYVGSINFSLTSNVSNRELGMYLYDATALQRINTILASDYNGASAY